MASPGGGGLDELVDAVDPVVDVALAEPYESVAEYRAAIDEIRSAAVAYYSGPDLAMDDATYDGLMARVAATEAAHPGWKAEDTRPRWLRRVPVWSATWCTARRC